MATAASARLYLPELDLSSPYLLPRSLKLAEYTHDNLPKIEISETDANEAMVLDTNSTLLNTDVEFSRNDIPKKKTIPITLDTKTVKYVTSKEPSPVSESRTYATADQTLLPPTVSAGVQWVPQWYSPPKYPLTLQNPEFSDSEYGEDEFHSFIEYSSDVDADDEESVISQYTSRNIINLREDAKERDQWVSDQIWEVETKLNYDPLKSCARHYKMAEFYSQIAAHNYGDKITRFDSIHSVITESIHSKLSEARPVTRAELRSKSNVFQHTKRNSEPEMQPRSKTVISDVGRTWSDEATVTTRRMSIFRGSSPTRNLKANAPRSNLTIPDKQAQKSTAWRRSFSVKKSDSDIQAESALRRSFHSTARTPPVHRVKSSISLNFELDLIDRWKHFTSTLSRKKSAYSLHNEPSSREDRGKKNDAFDQKFVSDAEILSPISPTSLPPTDTPIPTRTSEDYIIPMRSPTAPPRSYSIDKPIPPIPRRRSVVSFTQRPRTNRVLQNASPSTSQQPPSIRSGSVASMGSGSMDSNERRLHPLHPDRRPRRRQHPELINLQRKVEGVVNVIKNWAGGKRDDVRGHTLPDNFRSNRKSMESYRGVLI